LGNVNTSCIPPSALNTTNITTNSAMLSWSTVLGSVTYDVSYKPTSFCCWTSAATATTSTSVNLSGLNPSTSYDWKVRANCSSSSAAYRWGAPFTTLDPCGTPSGLTTTNITFNSATLNWSAVPNAINYTVQYKQSTSALWISVATGINALSYNLSGLLPTITYDWRVLASCNVGPGNYTQASFTTLCNDIYEPNNISNQAKAIVLGSTISAGISSATDVDWFKITMPNNANTTLQATLSNLPADYDLYVYNKNLGLVAWSTNAGTMNETLIYSSRARNATYYIEVVGKNGAYSAIGCYNLLVQAVAGSVITAAPNAAKEITPTTDKQSLYPNPASAFVYLRFNSSIVGPTDVQILNTLGQQVKQYPVKVVNGYNDIKIPINDIIPGMYVLRINKEGLSLIKRFVIAR